MIIKRRHHRQPGLNTTSTADISFMMLIFFLVTTSMDSDKGLVRRLPHADPRMHQQETQVDKNTVMDFTITADNKLLLHGKPVPLTEVQGRVGEFVRRLGKRHLITITTAPDASYDAYFHLQNELVGAYRKWRDETARRLYHKGYDALEGHQRMVVRDHCPQRISEDYSMKAGGQS